MTSVGGAPGIGLVVDFATGWLLNRLAGVGPVHRFLTSPVIQTRRKAYLGVARSYSTQAALWAIQRPGSSLDQPRRDSMRLRENGAINWPRVLEVTAELLIILGPLLKLAADYARDRRAASRRPPTA